ncbi:SusD/RagB family nutrient-binding outer membrane lipoprotein [Daejeonella sp. H1SJ63]|jgi:hypothetical protein|uniref:SusD/RagB family nutrient-binding outer membrane lipoprotein n=1 Tax=Daejeonella sp. H1SJ63 TaxID=3034145 RepID=UPI0023ED6283|nr:SusD/RagB family nutrient-binding outer membrane lipoprotein [Daejeonella sp. H1SJ63]
MKSQKSLYRKWASRVMLLIAPMLILTACTKNFEEINTNPSGLKELTAPDLRSLFPGALVTGLGASYNETTMLLFAGVYSQHFAGTNPAQESHRYVIVQRWMDIWPGTYVSTMPKLVNIIEATKGGKEPSMNAVARMWKVYAFMRLTDYFGPIPYSKIGKDTTVVNYDDQKSIYFDFFKELDEATNDLKNNLAKPSFATKDLIYNGDNAKWLKFGNTLRLRLALRISDVEPAKAKLEAEKAFAGGVMTEVADGAFFKTSADFPHGLNNFMGRNGSRMSTSMESLLVGYNDPRLPKLWSPALSDGKFHGVRNGMSVAQQNMPQNSINSNSAVGPKYQPVNMNTTPQAVMYASEAYFLRAEGALNGWNMGGTAQSLYEKGIETSMREHEVTDAAAIANYINGTSLPIAPDNAFPTPALTDIPVKFASDPEKQREQIGTQKWIALFPESHEAWASIRRSGYPKFYPLLNSQNPDIAPDMMIRRISFLDREIIANGVAVKAAVPLLGGGPDNVATRLWWDKSKSK